MATRKRTKKQDAYLALFGENLERLIHKKGFKSPYEFWIERAGDDISRSALNYIVKGQIDCKLSTIHTLARCLGVSPKELLNF